MHRFRVPEIFLGCFLTIAVFAVGMLFKGNEQTSRPKQAIEKQETSGERSKAESPDAELTGSTWLTKDAAGFFTFLLVAVGIGQAFLFFIQLRYMRKGMDDAKMVAEASKISADAAMKSAQTAERALIASDRAWISINAEVIDALVFEKDRVLIGVGFDLTNVGKSPATHVEIWAELCADIVDAQRRGNDYADPTRVGHLDLGVVLFPRETRAVDRPELTMPAKRFREIARETYGAKANPGIMVCVAYRLSGSPKVRRTVILYQVSHIDASHPGWDGAEGKTDLVYLKLTQNMMSGKVT